MKRLNNTALALLVSLMSASAIAGEGMTDQAFAGLMQLEG